MMLKIKRIYDQFINGICVTMLVLMTVVIFYQVFGRYVLGSSPSWTEEVGRYLFIWVSFLGAVIAFRKNAHLGVDFFVGYFPPALRKIADLIVTILLLIILGIIVYYGWEMSGRVEHQVSPSLRLSMTYAYLSVPVGAFLMMIEILWNQFYVKKEGEA